MDTSAKNILQLGKLSMNHNMLNNEEYSKVIASYADNGIAYQGSKRYLSEILIAVENYLNDKQGVCEMYDIFSGGGAITVNAAECIESIYANDLDTTIAIYPTMCSGRTFEALKYLYEFYIIKAEEYVKEHNLNVIADEYCTFGKTPNKLEKDIYKYLFKLVADDSNNDFVRCIEWFRGSDKSVTDSDAQIFVAGLSLFISYGSNNNSRKDVDVNKVNAFLKGICDMLVDWNDSLSDDGDNYAPFLAKYFSVRNKAKGKDILRNLFATEYAMMHKNITYSKRDALELLDDVEYKAERLIVADPPYPSKSGNKYNKDDFKWVDFSYQLLGKLLKIGSPFLMFCDEDSVDVFSNVVNRNVVNMYSFNVRRQNKNALEYVMTNVDLPTAYDELPEALRDLTKKAYKAECDKGMEIRDLDKTNDMYIPLRKLGDLPAENSNYNKVLYEVFDELGLSQLLS